MRIPRPVDPRYGEIIVREMKAQGITRAELARASGVAYTTVWRIEHGIVEPTLGTLGDIAVALGRDLADLHP